MDGAFSFPYYAFDLLNPELLFSAIVMLIVAITTGKLTTQIKLLKEMNEDSKWLIRMVENLLLVTKMDSEKDKVSIAKLPIVLDGHRNNMGIGLSVCAAIVKAHGSQLKVRNLSPGAEFYFYLEMEDENE